MLAPRAIRTATAAAAAAALGVLIAVGSAAPSGAASRARLYLVQGLPGRAVDIALDGHPVAAGLQGATLTGPFAVTPGSHTLEFTDGGTQLLASTISLAAGASRDLVLHLPASPGGKPVVTAFANDLAAIPAGKAAVTVAHTAAVPPADILVNGNVLFANVANGESLSLVVPAGSYTVKIVPTGKTTPVILGPLTLTVKPGALNRVFAVGDPASTGMRVVVQVIDLNPTGSGQPGRIDTGTGGQATGHAPLPAPLPFAVPAITLTR